MSALKQPMRHDDLLNYQIKRLFSIGGAPAVRLCEGGYGVSRLHWRLTAALAEHGPMTLGQLVALTGVETARASRTAKELVEKGLVVRSGRNGRTLGASESGQALYQELLPQLAAINARIMEVLTEAEALQLEDFLRRLTAQARAIAAAGDGVALKTGRHLGSARRRPAFRDGARAMP